MDAAVSAASPAAQKFLLFTLDPRHAKKAKEVAPAIRARQELRLLQRAVMRRGCGTLAPRGGCLGPQAFNKNT
jgi:hypothetical protein